MCRTVMYCNCNSWDGMADDVLFAVIPAVKVFIAQLLSP